jgi:hypothetical protein
MSQGIPADSMSDGERPVVLRAEPVLDESEFFHIGPAGVVTRAFCVVCAAAAIVLIGLAASLTPDPRGHGTHEKLGLAPCGFRWATGYPCPTCGMTTAFAEMAQLRPVRAFVHQPFGAVLFLGLVAATCGWLYTAATGRRWHSSIGLFLRSPRFLYGMVALGLASWGYLIFMAWLENSHGSP